MKNTIRIYINTILLFLIPFVVVSLILAILSYFIQFNSGIINILIQVLSYASLLISALYFTSQMNKNRFIHCFCFSLLYFLCSLLIHLGNLNYIHLFLKSLLFLIIGIYKDMRNKIV